MKILWICFVSLFMAALARADEYYDNAFKTDPTPTLLDAINVITERPRGVISRASEKAVERYIRRSAGTDLHLKEIDWMERNARIGYDERLNTIGLSGQERVFPAKLADKLRKIDLGFGNLYPGDNGPSFRVGKEFRLRLRWYHGGPAIALTVPWPMRS